MIYTLLVFAVIFVIVAFIMQRRSSSPSPFEVHTKRITRIDICIMVVVTFFYAVLAFVNLGDCTAPKMNRAFEGKKQTVAAFSSTTRCTSILYYKGLGSGKISVITSLDGENWTRSAEFDAGAFCSWTRVDCDFTARFVGVDSADPSMELCEIAFFDANGAQISLVSNSPIFDEQDTVPQNPSFLNSTYFDEIYHARTAYEHINLYKQYENTHPPLGKLIIAVGISLFGMNPFGWRFMGTLFGALMLPLIYLFAKRMFKNTPLAAFAMLLLAFDFMHFAQTRIATIDTYGVFFIMLMYYFMYIYYDSTPDELPFKKAILVLFLSGVSFGLGVASKWIALYAGVGLAVLFFMALYRRQKQKGGEAVKTILLCVLFFVIIPSVIYFLSYIPVFLSENSENWLETLINYQKHMFTYHSDIDATHPFSSAWYEWPLMKRPIWYWGADTAYLPEGMAASIVSLGNPVVWWGGTIFMIVLAAFTFIRPSKTKVFIFIGFLSQYLPWCFIGRIVFIYHFFASVPFIILATAYIFRSLGKHVPNKYLYMGGYIALAALLFAFFYPILSGMSVTREYIMSNLKWFSSWTLCY